MAQAQNVGFDAGVVQQFIEQEQSRNDEKQKIIAGLDQEIARLTELRASLAGETPTKRRGRKPGSKNAAKTKTVAKKKTGKRGRPKGSGKKKAVAGSGSAGNG